jgi:hypothetical protein
MALTSLVSPSEMTLDSIPFLRLLQEEGLRPHTYSGDTHANLSRLLEHLSWLIRKSAGDRDERAKIRDLNPLTPPQSNLQIINKGTNCRQQIVILGSHVAWSDLFLLSVMSWSWFLPWWIIDSGVKPEGMCGNNVIFYVYYTLRFHPPVKFFPVCQLFRTQ